MVSSSGAADGIRMGMAADASANASASASAGASATAGTAAGVARQGSHSRKPSHLSIDSNSANNAFLHTLNSQLQIAANSQHQQRHHHHHLPQDASNAAGASDQDFTLSLGIDREALIASDFSTDEFLSARRHLPLEELKSQLIAHMKELKTELIELINSDYTDFINLSTNLNGVDRMMEDLKKPLDRMKGDANAVKSNLQSVVDSLEQKLEHRAEIREKKASLQLLLNISESVVKVEGLLQISSSTEAAAAAAAGLRDSNESISVAKRLERVAIEYNQMQYLVSKGASLPFVTNIDWRLVRIKETMSENLANVLRACILPAQQKDGSDASADAAMTRDSLSQCLRTYALIDQTSEAEKVIAEDLLAPFIHKTITRAALTDHSLGKPTDNAQQPPQRPLVIMYNQILEFIHSRCGALINVTQKELKGTNFDIPVNCIWEITTQTIVKNIPQILTAGIPDDFHRNYTDTMDFVSRFEALCGSRRSLMRLRQQASYQAFMKRWQLPTYFQLRFRDISVTVEDALQMNVDTTSQRSPGGNVHLSASMAILRAIERCWSPEVFIYGVTYSFWKFTLQLMARYSIWITTNLAKDLDMPNKDRALQSRSSSPAPGSQGRSTPLPSGGALRPAGPLGRASLEELMLQQLSMMVNDIDHVASRLETIFSSQIRPKLPAAIVDEPVLLEAFDQNLQAIRQEIPGAQSRITEVITKQCGETLVSNVKAMAARASEGPPSEASHFVGMILMPLERYVAGAGALVLKAEAREAWALEVVKATTKQYAAALAERLAEVRESEVRTEKLKTAAAKARPGGWPRLQNAFSSSSSSISSATGSQDGGGAEGANMSTSDKLRLQFVLDVRSYKAELTKFNIDPDTFQPYLDLAANIQPYESLLAAAGLD